VSSQSVQDSSQSSYYYGMQRFLRFTDLAQISRDVVLPRDPRHPIPVTIIQLFLLWAKDEFAFNTIQISLSAINDWHRSRKLARDPQDLALISSTLKSVQLLLGPLGHADKKLGMSVDQGWTNPNFFFQKNWGWPSFCQKSSGLRPELFSQKPHISRGCPNFSPDPLDGPKSLSTNFHRFTGI
jgi:hypothetical protein